MKPFLQGKKNLGVPALTAPRSKIVPALGGSGAPSTTPPVPRVEVVKEGDKVVRLVFTCACGERTEVECLYSPGT
jgi:hypothetical protein